MDLAGKTKTKTKTKTKQNKKNNKKNKKKGSEREKEGNTRVLFFFLARRAKLVSPGRTLCCEGRKLLQANVCFLN